MRSTGHDPIPSLDVLGDRLEMAAARSIAGERTKGGVRSPRSPFRSRWVLVPALAVMVAAALVASIVLTDGSKVSDTAAADVIGAMKKSSAVATGHFHVAIDLETGNGSTHLEADGAYDTNTGRVRETIDASSLLARVAPEAALIPAGVKAEVVVDRGTIYASFPRLGSKSGQPRWVRLGSSPASGPGTQVTPSASDPSGLLELFGGVADVEQLGDEEIDGVTVRHYRGEVDLAKAYAGLSEADRKRLDESIGSIGGGLPRTGRVPVEVWVDGQGMVRRLGSTIDLTDELGGAAREARFTIDFSKLGEPVTIDIPDPATVTELSGLADLLPGRSTTTR